MLLGSKALQKLKFVLLIVKASRQWMEAISYRTYGTRPVRTPANMSKKCLLMQKLWKKNKFVLWTIKATRKWTETVRHLTFGRLGVSALGNTEKNVLHWQLYIGKFERVPTGRVLIDWWHSISNQSLEHLATYSSNFRFPKILVTTKILFHICRNTDWLHNECKVGSDSSIHTASFNIRENNFHLFRCTCTNKQILTCLKVCWRLESQA